MASMKVSWPANRTGSPDAVVPRPQLVFADHVHELNASKGHGGRTEGLEPHHRSHLTLDRSMVLFDNIVEVLDLPDLNTCVARRVAALDRCGVGATLVDGNLRRCASLADRLVYQAQSGLAIPLRSQQEIDCVPALSTARYRYFHWPLVRTQISSIRQLPPPRRCRTRKACSSSGTYLITQRLRVE